MNEEMENKNKINPPPTPIQTDEMSISMILEHHIHSPKQKNLLNTSSLAIKPQDKCTASTIKTNPQRHVVKVQNSPLLVDKNVISSGISRSWIDDRIITHCSGCKTQFNIWVRKHHCRSCGQVFCHYCSTQTIKIPSDYRCQYQRENIFDLNVYYRKWIVQSEESRVCNTCFQTICEHAELDKMIAFFELIPLSIDDWYTLKLVCKTWYKISKIHLSRIRMVLYRTIPFINTGHNHDGQSASLVERAHSSILSINVDNIGGHSHWKLQYALSLNWNDPFVADEKKQQWLSYVIDRTRRVSCRKMMCRRNCRTSFSNEDIFFIFHSKITYYPLMRYLISIWIDQLSTTEFMCYLPSILMNMLFYSQFDDIRSELEVFLLRRSILSDETSHYLFWILTQTLNGSKIWYVGANQWVTTLRQKLVDMLDFESCRKLQYGYDFTHNLIQIVMSFPNQRINAIRDFLNQYMSNESLFTLPVNIHRMIRRIDVDRIHIVESKTEPIVIPCICDTSDNYTILLKKEDVRREEMMMRMLRLFDYYLKTEEGLDLYIRTYPILPISNQYGYIEFIPKSHTLFSIREQYRFSIQNFILERNPGLSIAEFRDRFTKSCAAFCVFTYFMGIGDRHLDNIMISEEDGTLFHIDYAYILGNDPKPIHPFSRLTPEMVDAMGGTSSIYYNQFCTYCEKAIHCIRRHQNVFHILLLYGCMIDNRISPEQINYFIMSRFMPNQTSHEVYRLFMKMLEDTNETYGIHLMDFIHKQYKKSNSAGQNESKSIIDAGLSKIGLSSSYELVPITQQANPNGYCSPDSPTRMSIHTHTDNYHNQITMQLVDTVTTVTSSVAKMIPKAMNTWSSLINKASKHINERF